MLPQFTGLGLSIAGLITGGLIVELVFSYPGLGTLLFNAIGQNDYPVIQAITLLITFAVVIVNFIVDVLTGFIDPRIRAVQSGER
jgi:peptide/nickel transport system permease protein